MITRVIKKRQRFSEGSSPACGGGGPRSGGGGETGRRARRRPLRHGAYPRRATSPVARGRCKERSAKPTERLTAGPCGCRRRGGRPRR
ncbi:hypothetical protein DDF65_18610 [Caulobacter radicis]|uniref:Uncharacterized protein n=1 Tax=Caulobacter radicis TaxID=2172650 RepID=A0A2T9J3L1_9CAUL|nr:hypothetical protein DDF65_18610 [Caulobacter radicis]